MHIYHIYVCIMHISSRIPPYLHIYCLSDFFRTGKCFRSHIRTIQAICMVILLLYHCYTTVCADCILYQVYQWYSHRIWHISQWKVCYMPQNVPPDTFLDGIHAYTSYTICYTKLYLHTRMLYFYIRILYHHISAATTSWVPSRVTIHRIDCLDAGNYTVNCLNASNRRAYDISCTHHTHNSVYLSCIRWSKSPHAIPHPPHAIQAIGHSVAHRRLSHHWRHSYDSFTYRKSRRMRILPSYIPIVIIDEGWWWRSSSPPSLSSNTSTSTPATSTPPPSFSTFL